MVYEPLYHDLQKWRTYACFWGLFVSIHCSLVFYILGAFLRTFVPIASLVRTLFIGHARATSFSSTRTKSKTQQNIELMTFAFIWCANIFVGCSVTSLFFQQITSFSDAFHFTKKQKNSVNGKFYLFLIYY